MTLDVELLARLERLRAAIPPAELRADDVDAESQLDLALELLDRAAEHGREQAA